MRKKRLERKNDTRKYGKLFVPEYKGFPDCDNADCCSSYDVRCEECIFNNYNIYEKWFKKYFTDNWKKGKKSAKKS